MFEILLGSLIAKAGRGFRATVTKVGDVVVIRPEGQVTFRGGDTALRDLVIEALDRGERRILLNLSGVTVMDSRGIGELVAAYTAATRRSAVVRVCCLSEKVFSLFQMVALIRVFDVRENETAAVAAFAEQASA